MRKIHRLFATLSVAAVIAGPGAPTAQAGDYKAFPGSMCVRNNDYSGGTPYYGSSGRLFNSSTTSWLRVICPIVRDNETGSPSFQVIVIDQYLSDGVSCRAVSNSRDGTANNMTAVVKSSGNASTGKEINLGGIASKENFGHHHILCSIPPKGADNSAIASYIVLEP
jgi:phage-related tail fiber protein